MLTSFLQKKSEENKRVANFGRAIMFSQNLPPYLPRVGC